MSSTVPVTALTGTLDMAVPVTNGTNHSDHKDEKELDEEQLRLMAEECILINEQDEEIGHASKKECHLNTSIQKGMLHRAFSVFLFNSKNELLLQQRSAAKITFPLRWTNTCCSHPLYVHDEREMKDGLGVKRAARRKLEHELGIPESAINLDEIHFLTRIHYKALSDGLWGEHEIDHILFIRKDIDVKPVANEVAAVRYVTPEQLEAMYSNKDEKAQFITPWFHMIADAYLGNWWKNLDAIIANKGLNDPKMTAAINKLEL